MLDDKGQVGSPSPTQPGPRLSKYGKRLGRPPGSVYAKPRPKRPPVGMPKVPLPPGTPVDRLGRSLVVRVAKQEEAKRTAPPKLVTVNLSMRHSFNGKFYGPGKVLVSPTKADVFLNTEHIAAQKEMSLTRQDAFIINYGPHGGLVKRQVPWARFDDILAREELPLDQLPQEGR